jgi:uncharacterized protein (TIGR03905 family)
MKFEYKPKGTCATKIIVELDGDIIQHVEFVGGCDGNAKGLCAMVEGMNADDIVSRLQGITCGFKKTFCPDQLSKALAEARNQHN